MVEAIDCDKDITSLLNQLKIAQSSNGFVKIFCQILVDLCYQPRHIDCLLKSLALTCRDNTELLHLTNAVFVALKDMGYDQQDVVDLRVGRDDAAQIAVFSGKAGTLVTEDKNFFQGALRGFLKKKSRTVADIRTIRQTICDIQRSNGDLSIITQ